VGGAVAAGCVHAHRLQEAAHQRAQAGQLPGTYWPHECAALAGEWDAPEAGAAPLRPVINGFRPKEAPPQDYYAMMREVHAIGNKLNQLAHRANCTGEMDATNIEAAITEIRHSIKDITQKMISPEPLAQDGAQHLARS